MVVVLAVAAVVVGSKAYVAIGVVDSNNYLVLSWCWCYWRCCRPVSPVAMGDYNCSNCSNVVAAAGAVVVVVLDWSVDHNDDTDSVWALVPAAGRAFQFDYNETG